MPEGKFQKIMQQECILQIADCDEQVRSLSKFRVSLSDSMDAGLVSAIERDSLSRGYNEEILQLEMKIDILQRMIHSPDKILKDELVWRKNFLQFRYTTEFDRAAIVRIIQSICIFSKTELAIHFAYQSEYERAMRYTELGGDAGG